MAQSQTIQTDELITATNSLSGDLDEEQLEEFMTEALSEVVSHLESNRQTAQGMSRDVNRTVGGVLDPSNISEIDIRAEPLENPRVRVWLHDAPVWANDAWNEIIYPRGLNAYNGKTRVTFDVRPY